MDLADYDLDPRYHRILPDGRLLDLSPTHCPNGHLLEYPNLLRYATNFGGKVVPRWLCWTCNTEWSRWPIPGAVHWPGVDAAMIRPMTQSGVPVPRPPKSTLHERGVSDQNRVLIDGQHVPVIDDAQSADLARALEAIDPRLNRGADSKSPRAIYSHIMQGKDTQHMRDQMRYRHDAADLTDDQIDRALAAISRAFEDGRQP